MLSKTFTFNLWRKPFILPCFVLHMWNGKSSQNGKTFHTLPFISLSVKRGCWTWSLTSSFGFLPIPISGFDIPLTFLQRGKLLFWILAVWGFPAQLSLFKGNNGDFQVASTLPNTYLGVSEKANSTPSFHSLPDQGHVTSPKLNHVPPSPWRFSN